MSTAVATAPSSVATLGPSDNVQARVQSCRQRNQEDALGIYVARVLPRIMNVACGSKQSRPLRERVCAGLRGQVVEIGFGSGHNVPFYPDTVHRVSAIEPSQLSWKLAQDRVSASAVTVERSGLDAQSLAFADDTFDTALSTWTLCTIPDPTLALTEVHRVLRPGGTLHFIEHGLAPDEGVQRWQRRLEPLNKRLAGGCHLMRPILDLLKTAGFSVVHVDVFYEAGAPKPLAADSLGVVVAT
jgi:SAM-dependent methyltransferase